jgi:hypothetical protein
MCTSFGESSESESIQICNGLLKAPMPMMAKTFELPREADRPGKLQVGWKFVAS